MTVVESQLPRTGLGISARAGASDDLRVCAAFQEVAVALAEGRDLEQVLQLITDKLCELTGRIRCSIHLVDPESGLLRGRAAHAPTDIDAEVRRLVSGGPGDGFTREVLATRRPVALVDTLSDPRAVRSAMRRFNARSVLGVAMVLGQEVVGMVCLDDGSTPGTFSDHEQEIVTAFADLAATAVRQAQLTSQLKSSLATVAKQVERLNQASRLEKKLTEIVLRGCTLRQIGETVAELLGKPCAIYDPQFRQLVLSPSTAAGEPRPRLLDAEIRAVPAVAAVLAALRAGTPAVVEPAPWAGLHHRLLVSSVMLGAHLLGYIAVGECGRRLSVLDEAVVSRAAASIALERSGERRAAETEWHTVESFTGSLLRGDEPLSAVEERAEVLGLRLDAPRVVCLIGRRQTSALGLSVRELARRLTGPASPSAVIGAPCGEDIAVIMELPDNSASRLGVSWVKRQLHETLAEIGCEDGLLAAVSSVAKAPGEDSRAHVEARQVLTCMRNHLAIPGDQVLAADDLGAGRLLLAGSQSGEALRFGRDALGPLLDEDAKSHELLVTLAAFMDAGRSVSRAAAILGVHTNTIRYRMARIEKLTGLDVASDANAQLTTQLALLVLRLNGQLPLVSSGEVDADPD